ncbi:VOC family protein [Erythrobacter sp. HA6-11]
MKLSACILAVGLTLASCAAVPEMTAEVPDAPASPEAIKGVHHVGITVSDIDDTVAFYAAAVPFELVERSRLPASSFPEEILEKRTGEVEVALIRTPTVFIQLIDPDPDGTAQPNRRPVEGPGYTHICFQSPSTAPKYDRFKEIGMEMLSRGDGPVDLGGYGVTYAYGFDPDGIMIEMEQLDPAVLATQGELGRKRMEHPAWVTHVANVPGDKATMVAFYTKILGYGPRREIPLTRLKTIDDVVNIDDVEVSASWFGTANFELEFWHYHKPQTPHRFTRRTLDEIGYNSVVFEVTDLAGTIARLEPQGIAFAGSAFELNGWRIRYARDPEGNLLAFQERVSAPTDQSIDDMLWLKDRPVPQTGTDAES